MPLRWSGHRLAAWSVWLKRPVFWIVLCALVLRLPYVLSGAPTPVQFDARIYVSSALALSLAVAHPSILFDAQARQEVSFDLVYADLVRGESIEWLYYDPPTFDQALEWVYFSGPAYPVLLGIVFWPPWAHDFAAARVANALLDAISCALLFWILRKTAGRTAALVGAGLFAVYPGAIIKCGELNLESLASSLVVLAAALCISAILDERPRRFFAAGVVGGLLLLTKASLSLMIVFLGAAVIVVLWRTRSSWRGAVWRMAAGFALIVVPWIILVWMHYGTPSVRDPQYGAANFRSSNILPNRGYDLDYAREDFWTYPVGREITTHPFRYLGLYVEKVYRLWNRPYNDYRVPLVLGVNAQVWFHRLLVLGAAIGIFFWPRRDSRFAAHVAVAALIYVSVMHAVWHSLARYALPVIPLAIGAAAVGGVAIVERLLHRRSLRTSAVIGAAAMITITVWTGLTVGRMLGWFGALSPETANALVVLIRAIILAGDGYMLVRILGQSRQVWAMWGVLMVCGQVVLWVISLPRESWAEWSAELRGPQHAVERVIQVPPQFDVRQLGDLALLMDIQSGGGEQFVLNVRLDSMLFPLPGGSYAHSFYSKASYKPFLEAYRVKKEQIRQWVTFAIPREDIDSLFADGRLLVRIGVTGAAGKDDFIRVFGDYRPRAWREWEGPTVEHSSVERLYEEGDPRIWERIPRELAGAENRWIDRGFVNSRDLSPAAGLQSGDYRLIIQGTTGAGTNVYF